MGSNLKDVFEERVLLDGAVIGGPSDEGAANVPLDSAGLRLIEKLDAGAKRRWNAKLVVEPALSRALVSFQANKTRAVYRWFKYKEAFSAGLLEYLHNRYRITSGTLLDPFAGSGTALFTAGGFGLAAEGIELLPIGQKIIDTKQLIDWEVEEADIARLEHWLRQKPWVGHPNHKPPLELRITRGAYPQETLRGLGRFLSASENEGVRVKAVLLFALLCILESVSFTRKDGQYLRWDHRSGRRQGKKRFDKGAILNFDEAITDKLHQIVTDLRQSGVPNDLFASPRKRTEIRLHAGSCLEIMPRLQAGSFDCVITSPPYCNRYDYTRTYALELALLGVGEEGLAKLRQEMLSCTVENRAKDLIALNPNWRILVSCADDHELLQAILGYLEWLKELKLLNNTGIARMVRGYFYEMACVIAESARVLKKGAPLIMVNDNVRYAGASISVDIILTEMAQLLGFEAEHILVLPNGKGNSSQQMGAHGREPLRKCVYVWRKT
ncbi:MAG: site-specific DNA-methyltransferase [Verrucomicrobiota bacterium]